MEVPRSSYAGRTSPKHAPPAYGGQTSPPVPDHRHASGTRLKLSARSTRTASPNPGNSGLSPGPRVSLDRRGGPASPPPSASAVFGRDRETSTHISDVFPASIGMGDSSAKDGLLSAVAAASAAAMFSPPVAEMSDPVRPVAPVMDSRYAVSELGAIDASTSRVFASEPSVRAMCRLGDEVWCATHDGDITVRRAADGALLHTIPRRIVNTELEFLHVPAPERPDGAEGPTARHQSASTAARRAALERGGGAAAAVVGLGVDVDDTGSASAAAHGEATSPSRPRRRPGWGGDARGNEGFVTALVAVPTQRQVWSGSSLGNIAVWQCGTLGAGHCGPRHSMHPPAGGSAGLKVSSPGRAAGAVGSVSSAGGTGAGSCGGGGLAGESGHRKVDSLSFHVGSVNALARCANFVVSGGNDFKIAVWDATTRVFVRQLAGHGNSIRALASASFPVTRPHLLYSSADDGHILAWAVPHGDRLALLSAASGGHRRGVAVCALAVVDQLLWSGAQDGSVRVWDISNGHSLARSADSVHTGRINFIVPVGGRVWVGGGDGRVSVWNAHSLEMTTVVAAHNPKHVRVCLPVIRTASVAVWSAGGDQKIRIWGSVDHDVRDDEDLTRGVSPSVERFIGQMARDLRDALRDRDAAQQQLVTTLERAAALERPQPSAEPHHTAPPAAPGVDSSLVPRLAAANERLLARLALAEQDAGELRDRLHHSLSNGRAQALAAAAQAVRIASDSGTIGTAPGGSSSCASRGGHHDGSKDLPAAGSADGTLDDPGAGTVAEGPTCGLSGTGGAAASPALATAARQLLRAAADSFGSVTETLLANLAQRDRTAAGYATLAADAASALTTNGCDAPTAAAYGDSHALRAPECSDPEATLTNLGGFGEAPTASIVSEAERLRNQLVDTERALAELASPGTAAIGPLEQLDSANRRLTAENARLMARVSSLSAENEALERAMADAKCRPAAPDLASLERAIRDYTSVVADAGDLVERTEPLAAPSALGGSFASDESSPTASFLGSGSHSPSLAVAWTRPPVRARAPSFLPEFMTGADMAAATDACTTRVETLNTELQESLASLRSRMETLARAVERSVPAERLHAANDTLAAAQKETTDLRQRLAAASANADAAARLRERSAELDAARRDLVGLRGELERVACTLTPHTGSLDAEAVATVGGSKAVEGRTSPVGSVSGSVAGTVAGAPGAESSRPGRAPLNERSRGRIGHTADGAADSGHQLADSFGVISASEVGTFGADASPSMSAVHCTHGSSSPIGAVCAESRATSGVPPRVCTVRRAEAAAAVIEKREAELAAARRDAAELADMLEASRRDLGSARAELAGLRDAASDLVSARAEGARLRRELEDARAEAAACTADSRRLRQQLAGTVPADDAAAEAARLRNSLQEAQRQATEEAESSAVLHARLRDAHDQASTTAEAAEAERRRSAAALSAAHAEVDSAKQEVDRLRALLQEKQGDAEAAAAEVRRLRGALRESMPRDEAVSDMARLRAQLSEAQSAAADAEGNVARLRQQVQDLHEQLVAADETTTARLSKARVEAADATAMAESRAAEVARLQASLRAAQTAADTAAIDHRAEIDRLRKQLCETSDAAAELERVSAILAPRAPGVETAPPRAVAVVEALSEAEGERDASAARLTAAKGRISELEKVIEAERQRSVQLPATTAALEEARREIARVCQQLATCQGELLAAEAAKRQHDEQLAGSAEDMARLNADNEQLRETHRESKEALSSAEARIRQLEAALREAKEAFSSAEARIRQLEAALREAKEAFSSAEARIRQLEAALREAPDKELLDEARRELAGSRADAEMLRRKLEDSETQVSALRRDLEAEKDELADARRALTAAQNDLAEQRRTAASLSAEAEGLRRAVQVAQSDAEASRRAQQSAEDTAVEQRRLAQVAQTDADGARRAQQAAEGVVAELRRAVLTAQGETADARRAAHSASADADNARRATQAADDAAAEARHALAAIQADLVDARRAQQAAEDAEAEQRRLAQAAATEAADARRSAQAAREEVDAARRAQQVAEMAEGEQRRAALGAQTEAAEARRATQAAEDAAAEQRRAALTAQAEAADARRAHQAAEEALAEQRRVAQTTQVECSELRRQLSAAQAEAGDLKRQLTQANADAESARRQASVASAEAADLRRQLSAAQQAEDTANVTARRHAESAANAEERLAQAARAADERVAALQRELSTLKGQFDGERRAAAGRDDELAALSQRHACCADEIADLHRRLTAAEAAASEAGRRASASSEEASAAGRRLSQQDAALADALRRLAAVNGEAADAAARHAGCADEVANLERRLAAADAELESARGAPTRIAGLQRELEALRRENDAARDAQAASEQEAAANRHEAERARAALEEAETELQRRAELLRERENERVQLDEELERIRRALQDRGGDSEGLQKRLDAALSKAEETAERAERLAAREADLQAELQRMRQQHAELQSELCRQRERASAAERDVAMLREQLANTDAELARLREELARATGAPQEEVDALRAAAESTRHRVGELEAAKAAANQHAHELDGQLQNARGQLQVQEGEIASLHREKSALEAEVEELRRLRDQLQNEVGQLRAEVIEKDREVFAVTARNRGLEEEVRELKLTITTRSEVQMAESNKARADLIRNMYDVFKMIEVSRKYVKSLPRLRSWQRAIMECPDIGRDMPLAIAELEKALERRQVIVANYFTKTEKLHVGTSSDFFHPTTASAKPYTNLNSQVMKETVTTTSQPVAVDLPAHTYVDEAAAHEAAKSAARAGSPTHNIAQHAAAAAVHRSADQVTLAGPPTSQTVRRSIHVPGSGQFVAGASVSGSPSPSRPSASFSGPTPSGSGPRLGSLNIPPRWDSASSLPSAASPSGGPSRTYQSISRT
eukprot:TRINITY_DN422_c0_g1_i1.p1 TRINITY_DN422_c0_g1~~TRINITY_DN422_c0_g1_i1.p1  ORF type:complete len:2900 (+),score=294.18 TRINITY_DN422_c0_g1_i1:55-8754(+)